MFFKKIIMLIIKFEAWEMFLRTHVTLNYTKSSKSPFFRKRNQDEQTLLKLSSTFIISFSGKNLYVRELCVLSLWSVVNK